MSRHLKLEHSQEPSVAKLLNSDKKTQKLELQKLRHMGDFNYNVSVYEKRRRTAGNEKAVEGKSCGGLCSLYILLRLHKF